jgi:hypothetical protein
MMGMLPVAAFAALAAGVVVTTMTSASTAVRVKHFQAIHDSSVNVARGLATAGRPN